jgi:hypothetical protein
VPQRNLLPPSSQYKMEITGSPETVPFYKTTWSHIPGDSDLVIQFTIRKREIKFYCSYLGSGSMKQETISMYTRYKQTYTTHGTTELC